MAPRLHHIHEVNGEKFTAFLIERNFPGFAVGAEEHKMGIRGSSTCPIILNDCKVPVENVLGEIGKGHIIAFNILNVGRFKLGAMCVGGGRVSLEHAIAYAKQRKAFNKVIADFGLVREKIANMATLLFVGESLVYRTVALMDSALSEVDKSAPDAAKQTLKAIEEYAVECSIIKVWGSEMIDYVVDETVQIYGGYGFVEEYPAERAYRDARINRIFEGTNEINRLIITGFLLKRAMSGQLPLMPAIKKLMDDVLSGPSMGEEMEGPLADERKLVGQAKKLGLFAAGAATHVHPLRVDVAADPLGDASLPDHLLERDAEGVGLAGIELERHLQLADGLLDLRRRFEELLLQRERNRDASRHLRSPAQEVVRAPGEVAGLGQSEELGQVRQPALRTPAGA